MVHYVADPAFGETLNRLRTEAGLSLRDLAHRALSSKSHVHDFENNRRVPSAETCARLDAALGAEGRLTAMIRPGGGMPRRTFVGLAAGVMAGIPDGGEFLRAGRRLDADVVDVGRQRTARIRRLDDLLGGADTYRTYAAELQATTALLTDGSYGGDTERGLLTLVADQAQLTGWAAFDAGWHDEARRLFELSLPAARTVDDRGLIGNAYALLGYQSLPGTSVDLLSAAYDIGRDDTPKVRALLAERAAWAYASAGLADDAAAALDTAETALSDANPDQPEPDWVFWIDPTELQIMTGRCWTVLHRPLRAIAALDSALANYGDTHGRDKALYVTYLASAYLQAGEVEHACELLHHAITLAADVATVRPRQHVNLVIDQLAPFGHAAAVREIQDRAASWPHRSLTSGSIPGTTVSQPPAQ